MSSTEVLRNMAGTRLEPEAAAFVLERAKDHVLNNPIESISASAGDLLAACVLGNLSLLVFPEQETKFRRGGL